MGGPQNAVDPGFGNHDWQEPARDFQRRFPRMLLLVLDDPVLLFYRLVECTVVPALLRFSHGVFHGRLGNLGSHISHRSASRRSTPASWPESSYPATLFRPRPTLGRPQPFPLGCCCIRRGADSADQGDKKSQKRYSNRCFFMENLVDWLDIPHRAAKRRVSNRTEETETREFPAHWLLFGHRIILNRGAD